MTAVIGRPRVGPSSNEKDKKKLNASNDNRLYLESFLILKIHNLLFSYMRLHKIPVKGHKERTAILTST